MTLIDTVIVTNTYEAINDNIPARIPHNSKLFMENLLVIKNRDSPSFNEASSDPKSKNATLLNFYFHDWIGKTKKTLLQPKPTAPIFCFLLPILSDLTNNHRRDVAATRSGDNSSMSSIPIVAIAEHSYLNCCAVGHYMVWQHANFKQSVSLRQSVEMS